MRKVAPFNRTLVIVSIAIGLIAFAVQAISVWNMPIGDEPAKINAVNTLLEQFRRGLQTDGNLYKVQGPDGREVNVFAHTAPTESGLPSLFDFTSLTNEGEHKIIVQVPEYTTSVQFPAKTEATAIMADLRNKFPPLPVAVHRTWDDVEAASHELVWANAVVLKAKTMQYLTANPDGSAESYEWTHRYELAIEKFSICSKAEHIRRSIGFGLMVFVIYAPLTWLVLLVIAWIRYLVLDRFRERPQAIDDRESGD